MFMSGLIISLIFIVAGGTGLFFTNVDGVVGTLTWIQGNIAFGAFLLVGLVLFVLLTIFSTDIE